MPHRPGARRRGRGHAARRLVAGAAVGAGATPWTTPPRGRRRPWRLGADLIALKLRSCHPDRGDDARRRRRARPSSACWPPCRVPLLVYGPGAADKDNEVLVAVAEATKGEQLALGLCEDKNYRTIVAAALGNGHAGDRPDADRRQPGQAAQHPHQRHGPAARARAHGPQHRRAGLRPRVHVLGDGAPAPGRPHGRRDDAAAHDLHRRRGGVAPEGGARRRATCPRRGATSPSAAWPGRSRTGDDAARVRRRHPASCAIPASRERACATPSTTSTKGA